MADRRAGRDAGNVGQHGDTASVYLVGDWIGALYSVFSLALTARRSGCGQARTASATADLAADSRTSMAAAARSAQGVHGEYGQPAAGYAECRTR